MARSSKGRKSRGRPARGSTPQAAGATQEQQIDWNDPPRELRVPSAEDIQSMSDDELRSLLDALGVTVPINQARAEMIGRLQRLITVGVDTPEFDFVLNDIVNAVSGQALLGAARKLHRDYGIIASIAAASVVAGVLHASQRLEFVRVCEADDHSCTGCLRLAGETGTRPYHESLGPPGSQQCGHNCRCELIEIV